MTQEARHLRLDGSVLPSHYDLELVPDIEGGGFEGRATISVEITEPCRSITLHALDLELHDVMVNPAVAGPVTAGHVTFDDESETATLELDTELTVGPAELEIHYSGRFCDRLVGMYSSTFTTDGVEQELVVTQCESTHARRFVPCFDEPAFKATFSVTLVVPDDLLAVSNAAEIGRESMGEGLVRVRFAKTPRMSTYLLAVVVGPLEVTDARVFDGRDSTIDIRVVHPPGKEALCDFALDVAEAALGFFEDYYDLPYPGDKLDLVAVPDFAFGAMENLGCVTFREVLLLVDPNTATPQELQRVADVINHEVAHMWFGNLVTMNWWNGIWLNEAFATFMEVSASDAFRPDWDVWTTFGLARAAAFETDALVSTRPIEYEVITAEDSEAMFDILTYEKGCSVLRMLEQYLGPEVFRAGIRAYLAEHAFANTDTTDLWDALETASGEPVRRIMDSWIFTGGHPLVSVEHDGGTARLSQQRALAEPSSSEIAAQRYPVPMVVRVTGGAADEELISLLLDGPTELQVGAPSTCLQPNAGGNGFYRSLLDSRSRAALAACDGTPLERFVLVDDTWFAMRSGLIDTADALETITAVIDAGEDDPSVWRRIAATCADLVRLAGTEHRDAAAAWVRDALAERFRHIGTNPSLSGRTAEVAGTLLATMGTSGADAAAIRRARELFESFPSEDDPADPAVSAAALEVVARHCDTAEHAEIERRWRAAGSPQEEQRHLSALVATADHALIERTFGLLDSDVRSQDAPYVYRRALTNPTLGGLAWRHMTGEWESMLEKFPSGSVPRMLEGVRSFTDEALADEVEVFLDEHPLVSGSLQVTQHLEAMRATVAAASRVQAGANQRPW